MDHPFLKESFDRCDTIKFFNPGPLPIAAGTFRIEGTTLGMVMQDVDPLQEGILLVSAPGAGLVMPKAQAAAFAVGEKVYWNVANGELDAGPGNTCVGFAVEPAGVGDATVRVHFRQYDPVV